MSIIIILTGSYHYSVSNNKIYTTAINTANCGLAGENKCTLAKELGLFLINSLGLVTYDLLPVVLADLTATLQQKENGEFLENRAGIKC